MSKPIRAFGVVLLAAGASTRMGSCKLLLPWGKRTILTHILAQWKSVEVAQIAPVLAPTNTFLQSAMREAGFSQEDWIINPAPEREMFSSLQEASRWKGWLPQLTHWIIALGDQPIIKTSTLSLLMETARKNPDRICQPLFKDQGAHPIILPACVFHDLSASVHSDLRAFIREREALRLRLPVEDAGVSEDLDTPEDYNRWKPDFL
ncbi:MAG: nucleotidyltransferase family protein [Chthoniobacterales bacterium]